jgi:raffinose/stachyose/melibiose transport system permease protein
MSRYKNWRIACLFLLPAILVYSVIVLYPLARAIFYSFTNWDGLAEIKLIGLSNYIKLIKDPIYLLCLRNNFYWLASSVFIIIPIALIFAIMLDKSYRGALFFQTLFFIPAILSSVVIALIWSFIYNPQFGLLNSLLRLIKLDFLIKLWLADHSIAIFSVLVANFWEWLGYIILILISGLKSIPNELYEAAEIDGVSEFSKAIQISIPLLWESVIITLILAISGSMKAFELVYILTNGGPGHSTELMATYMYKKAFVSFSYGYGSAISIMIFVISLVLTISMRRLLNRDVVRY